MAVAQAPFSVLTQSARKSYLRLFGLWSQRGLSPRAAGAAALAACETIEDIARLGRAYFTGSPNCGAKTLNELSSLAGWAPEFRTAADAIAASLRLSIPDPEEAHEAAQDAVIGLRRAGFIIAAKPRSSPTGGR